MHGNLISSHIRDVCSVDAARCFRQFAPSCSIIFLRTAESVEGNSLCVARSQRVCSTPLKSFSILLYSMLEKILFSCSRETLFQLQRQNDRLFSFDYVAGKKISLKRKVKKKRIKNHALPRLIQSRKSAVISRHDTFTVN